MKVGDKFRVKEGLEELADKTWYEQNKGKVLKVDGFNLFGHVTANGYTWNKEWIEPIKEDKTMNTWQMMKSLTENPDLKFQCDDGYEAYVSGTIFRLKYKGEKSNLDGNIRLVGNYADKWTPIPEPQKSISRDKAFQAMDAGKNIRCDYDGESKTYAGHSFTTLCENEPVTIEEIQHGVWYIE
jgi:hypothetical protein